MCFQEYLSSLHEPIMPIIAAMISSVFGIWFKNTAARIVRNITCTFVSEKTTPAYPIVIAIFIHIPAIDNKTPANIICRKSKILNS